MLIGMKKIRSGQTNYNLKDNGLHTYTDFATNILHVDSKRHEPLDNRPSPHRSYVNEHKKTVMRTTSAWNSAMLCWSLVVTEYLYGNPQ